MFGSRLYILTTLSALLVSLASFGQLTNWKYKVPFVIKNEDGISRTNYSFKLSLNTFTLISSGNMDATGKDLRFSSDCNGTNLLNFWIEKDLNTTSTVIWIYLEKLDSAENKVIYLFSNNPTATTASNFNNTFPSRLIIDGANSQFHTIRDSIWKYNYIELKSGVTSRFPSANNLTAPGKLSLQASKIVIAGNLLADGSGYNGVVGSAGAGPGGGNAAPVIGTSGGGGGHAGTGGKGAYPGTASTNAGNGGISYGAAAQPIAEAGSGGGAAGLTGLYRAGGAGGGAFSFYAEDIVISGRVSAEGADGIGGGITNNNASGGGAGGTVLLNAKTISVNGKISVKGGNGGPTSTGGFPGGGAGGGYIKVFYQLTYDGAANNLIAGGASGTGGSVVAQPGNNGISYEEQYAKAKASLQLFVAPTLTTSPLMPVCEQSPLSINAPAGFVSYDFYINGILKLSSAARSYSNVPAKNGDKIVCRLFTSSGCFVSSDTLVVNALPIPSVGFNTTAETALCEGESFNLIASSNAVAFQWQRNGANISGMTNNQLLVTDSGSYNLQVTGANGCTGKSATIHFSAREKPIVSAFSGDIHFCKNDSVYVVAGSTLPGNFAWFLNGIQVGNKEFIYLNSAGLYHAEQTTSFGCKGRSENINAITDALPEPRIDTSLHGGVLCTPNAYIEVSVEQIFQAYQWMKNGANLPANTESLLISNEGVYTIEVVGENGCRNVSPPLHVTRFGPFDFLIGDEATICSNDSVLVGNPAADNYNVNWKLNGITLPNKTGTFYTNQAGNYSLTVFNGGRCTSEVVAAVKIKTIPTGTLKPLTDTAFCYGSQFEFEMSTPATDITWYNKNSVVAKNVSKLSPISSGEYYVVLNNNGCITITESVKVDIHPVPPTPSFVVKFDSLISYYPTGNQWLLNHVYINGANERVYHILENGNYSLVNINEFGCRSQESNTINFQNTAIDGISSESFNVFPNPFQDSFTIHLEGEFNWNIISIEGRSILSGSSENQTTIETNQLPSGVYLLSITNSQGNITTRLIKR